MNNRCGAVGLLVLVAACGGGSSSDATSELDASVFDSSSGVDASQSADSGSSSTDTAVGSPNETSIPDSASSPDAVSADTSSAIDAVASEADAPGCPVGVESAGIFVMPPPVPDDGGSAGNEAGTLDATAEAAPVDATGSELAPLTCGAKTNPCTSIKDAIAQAVALAKPNVYLATGVYVEDDIALAKGVTLFGGYSVAGGWSRPCPVSAAATLIRPNRGTTTIAAIALGGSAALDALTLESKPQTKVGQEVSGRGESLYGLFAKGATTTIALNNVAISLVNGGRGSSGGAGAAATATASPGACVTGPNVENATKGNDGASGSGAAVDGVVGADGYVPSDGLAGADGIQGGNTSCTVSAGSCNACGLNFQCVGQPPACFILCQAATRSPGQCTKGCGANGGGGGHEGKGGGSSIAVYVSAAHVTSTSGTFSAGSGGDGGGGGIGQSGGLGNACTNGSDLTCCSACAGGGLGTCGCSGPSTGQVSGGKCNATKGGDGGRGGNAGGGSGGWAYSIAVVGGGSITTTDTTLKHGAAGKGGENGATVALAGYAGDRYE